MLPAVRPFQDAVGPAALEKRLKNRRWGHPEEGGGAGGGKRHGEHGGAPCPRRKGVPRGCCLRAMVPAARPVSGPPDWAPPSPPAPHPRAHCSCRMQHPALQASPGRVGGRSAPHVITSTEGPGVWALRPLVRPSSRSGPQASRKHQGQGPPPPAAHSAFNLRGDPYSSYADPSFTGKHTEGRPR